MRRRRRAEFTAKVRAQPAQSEREARPRRHAQHVRQHSQVESEGCLAAQTRSHVRQAARGVRMLPGPLKLRAGVRASGSPGKGGGRPGRAPSPSPSSRHLPPRLLPYPKGGHSGREAVHDEHHLPGEENEGVACDPYLFPPRAKSNPLITVRFQSCPRVESSQPASSLVHETLPPS